MERQALIALPEYTYLMSAEGMLKIGRSVHPGRRRHILRSDLVSRGLPPTVNILAVVPSTVISESAALALFAHFRVRDREWFADHPEIRAFFEGLRPAFIPGRWDHVATFFWEDDPRIPFRIRRKLQVEPIRVARAKYFSKIRN